MSDVNKQPTRNTVEDYFPQRKGSPIRSQQTSIEVPKATTVAATASAVTNIKESSSGGTALGGVLTPQSPLVSSPFREAESDDELLVIF